MKNLVSKLLFVSMAILPGCSGPSDYDECILKNMNGINVKMVAREIISACDNKFPEKEETKEDKNSVDIPPQCCW